MVLSPVFDWNLPAQRKPEPQATGEKTAAIVSAGRALVLTATPFPPGKNDLTF
jgi:hypothetical protein